MKELDFSNPTHLAGVALGKSIRKRADNGETGRLTWSFEEVESIATYAASVAIMETRSPDTVAAVQATRDQLAATVEELDRWLGDTRRLVENEAYPREETP